MRDGQRLVGLALLADPLRPVVHGQVRPIVVPLLQLGPGLFEHLLPGLVSEERPERGSTDLDSIIVIGLVGRRNSEQRVAQLDQLQFEGLQRLELLFVVPRAGRPLVPQRRHVSADLPQLGLDEVVDGGIERLAGEARVVEPQRVAAGCGG